MYAENVNMIWPKFMLSGRYVVQQLETNLRSIENAFKQFMYI